MMPVVAEKLKTPSRRGLGRPAFLRFRADPLGFMARLSEAGPPVVRVRLGPGHFIFAFSPEAAQDILVRRAANYPQNRMIFDRIRPVTGKKGLVQLSGEASRCGRAKSRTLFAPVPLGEARAIIESYTDEFLDQVGSDQTLDVSQAMSDLVLRTALRLFLGIESPALVSRLGAAFLRLNHLCGLRMRALLPLPLRVPTPRNRELKKLEKEVRQWVAEHLKQYQVPAPMPVAKVFSGPDNRDEPRAQNPKAANPPAADFTESENEQIDQCMTFLFAGHETTASSVAFSLLLLAQNPVYAKAIAGGDAAMALAVYQETLRLYPPAYMLAREALGDDTLGGVRVRKGDQVIIATTVLHRDPARFTRPECFLPERFQDASYPPFTFIPFGAGGKSCVGEKLAYLEATVILERICRRCELTAAKGPIQADPLITLHPAPGQWIRFRTRLQENGEEAHAYPG